MKASSRRDAMTRGSRLACALALVSVSAVAAQAPPDAEGIFNMALTHLREGRTALAIDEFKKAVDADGKNPYFRKGLGLAYTRVNRFNDAIAQFRKALDLNPYYVDVRNDLGTALVLAGKRDEGKKEFLAAFNDATNPTPEISSRNLGQAYYEEKNYTEAQNWYRTSIGRNKAYPDAYLGLADCLVATGQNAEAIAQLQIGLKEVPEYPPLLVALGEVYYRSGSFTEARPRLEEAARKDPAGAAGRRAVELLKNFPK
jgi:tetratricopeptide (TPR) repeat protein